MEIYEKQSSTAKYIANKPLRQQIDQLYETAQPLIY